MPIFNRVSEIRAKYCNGQIFHVALISSLCPSQTKWGCSGLLDRCEITADPYGECCFLFQDKRSKDLVDFETAVSYTGYGKFHYLLLLVILPASWVSMVDTTIMSMILPSAQCDLQLTLFRKGVLNAITYAGMITSAILWGFFGDVHGRKKLLVYGFLADGICNLLAGFSQSFWMLLIFKYISGLLISGPYAIIMSYVAEFHGAKDRPRVLLLIGLFSTVANILIPLVAWLIIPQPWSLELFDGAFVYNSWRIFITICSAPAIIGAIGLSFFPESPKFLMFQSRNKEALEILRGIYAMNTGNSPEDYPVNSLENEAKRSRSMENFVLTESVPGPHQKSLMCLRDGCKQMKPLFLMPHLPNLLLCVTIQFGGMLMLNTIRLWLPQLFAILDNFANIDYDYSQGNPTFCQMLDISTSATANETATGPILPAATSATHHCAKVIVDSSVYLNTIIVSMASVVAFCFAGALVNVLGNKIILIICYIGCQVCVLSLNWSTNSLMTLILSCLVVSFGSITVNAMIGVVVDLFPTSLRTMAVSLTMMIGRSGSLLGNLVFPVLLSINCLAPILALAGLLILVVGLTTLIPKSSPELK